MASMDPAQPGFLRRLRGRHGQRAAIAVLVVLALIVGDNVLTVIRNQRELPRDEIDEMDDWFRVSSRDLEHVAAENPRFTVFGRIDIYYFLGQRIGGKTLTIPDWWEWARWELERVSHLDVEVAAPIEISGFQARRLRKKGEKRIFQKGSRKRRRIMDFYLVADPGATRYLMVESVESGELFVLSEERYASLPDAPVPPP